MAIPASVSGDRIYSAIFALTVFASSASDVYSVNPFLFLMRFRLTFKVNCLIGCSDFIEGLLQENLRHRFESISAVVTTGYPPDSGRLEEMRDFFDLGAEVKIGGARRDGDRRSKLTTQ